MSTAAETDAFSPPGRGGWKALADHFPGAVTPEYQKLYAETCPPGMATYMSRYGVLARTVDVGYVHGHLYITPAPIAGPREMRWTPPSFAVWLMARLHPEFRRRTRAAGKALADRPWRTAATHWFESERTIWQHRAQQLEAVDPGPLAESDLADHLRETRQFVADGYQRHFELHGDDLLPIGLLLARCAEWDIDAGTALRALDGVVPPAAAITAASWQLATGYDLDNRTWHELGTAPTPARPNEQEPLDLRPDVPAEHHAELEQLVSDARTAVPLRDDNGAITGAWPMGLLRRAMLEAGRRLELPSPELAVEATVDELIERLANTGGPSNQELADRHTDRQRRSNLDAPRTLGPEFAIPPLDPLPRALALIGAAQLAAADNMLQGDAPIGIGTRPHTGRALVINDPNEALDLIEPGDVVITQITSPAWNAILAYAGAIVTTTGGLLSHAAIIARELDIPAVIGDPSAVARFTTGTTVVVDPRAATVRTLV